jgi:hypothetical protein
MPTPSRRLRTGCLAIWLAAMAAAAGGCEVSKKSLLAPSDAIITLTSAHTFVPANGTTTITVQLKKSDGSNPVDGTEVVLTASAGELDQQKLRLRSGQATATFRAGPTSGLAHIAATSGSISAQISLRIGSAPPGNLTLHALQPVLPPGGGETEIVATVSASNGALVEGAPVTFSTDAGTLSRTEAVTNAQGEARTTLATSGSATVRASTPGLEASVGVRVRLAVVIRVSASPAEPTVGQAVTIGAEIRDTGGQAIAGRLRFLFGDGQTRDLGTVTGSATTTYAYTREGGYNLSAEFTDRDGFVTRETIRVTVRAAPAPPPPGTPPPAPPPPGGGGAGADEIDPRTITWLHTDVSSWPITSRITNVTITRSEICVDHTGAGRFPTSRFGDIMVEGNVWIVASFNGRWYAATYDWLRPGQVCKAVTGDELGRDQIRIPPMDASWPGPRSGETVGFLVSTRARDGVPAGQERTNIVLVRWP